MCVFLSNCILKWLSQAPTSYEAASTALHQIIPNNIYPSTSENIFDTIFFLRLIPSVYFLHHTHYIQWI